VYEARGPAGDVAIRQLPPEQQAGGERERFLAAGRSQMTVSDPSIVPTFDVIDAPGMAWIVMMLVRAQTLQTAMLSRKFRPEETNAMLRRAAAALDYAHSHGLVHGDVKPSNIFLLPNQEVMVGDFAISAIARRDPRVPPPANLRHGYLSPEHFNVPMFLEARSDQFSLAVIAYEMYTGQLPFGSAPDHLTAVLAPEASPSRVDVQLPLAVDGPILKALSHNPAQRYSSCMEFVTELSTSMGAAPKTVKGGQGRLVAAAAFLGVLGIGAGAAHFLGAKRSPPSPVQAAIVQPLPEQSPEAAPVPPPQRRHSKKTAEQVSTDPAKSGSVVRPRKSSAASERKSQTHALAQIAPIDPPIAPAVVKRSFTIEVLSRTRRIQRGNSFAIGDPILGELGHGDLKAQVLIDGPPLAPSNRLTIEWTVNGVVTDRQKPMSPTTLLDYNNEPTQGDYKVTLRLDGQAVDEFTFRIAP
jgi:hypothetical protein